MSVSVFIAFFIMVTTAATLNAHGVTTIDTRPRKQQKPCDRSRENSPLPCLPLVSSAPACSLFRS